MKKIYSAFLSCLIAVMAVPLNPYFITKAETLYFDGNGTVSDPYKIESEDDLITLSELVASTDTDVANKYANASYIQTSDIQLTEAFIPIGTHPGVGFYGNYDGNYCSITELNVDVSGSYIGLFGWVKSGTIKNLSVYGEVHSTEAENSYALTGGLVGEICDGATIVNCSFNGTVSSDDSNVGGLAGQVARGASITGSYFNGTVNGNQNVGGLVGYVSDQTVESSISITHSYMAGQVSSTSTAESVGAIAGNIVTANESSVVSVNSNLYLYSACDGAVNSNSYIGCTKAGENALKAWIDVLGSPFIVNAESDNFNDGYPIFEWQSTPYEFNGDGTANDPYQISSKEELTIMRDLINSKYSSGKYNSCYYVQTADIDLGNVEWEPIGTRLIDGQEAGLSFFGNYNGQGHTIVNLNVNRDVKFAGLFGSYNGNKYIENLIVCGKVTSSGPSVGGICGEVCNGGGTIRNCAFIGDVTGSADAVGGVVGYAWHGASIENCYHNGNVTNMGESSVGGIVGHCTVGLAKIGNVSINSCYHVGTVTGVSGKTGGIVGFCEQDTKFAGYIYIDNCYYLKDSVGAGVNGSTSTSDVTELSSNLLKNAAPDLGAIYVNNVDAILNDGYPIFFFQKSDDVVGDANLDGTFNVADVVMLQKWLLCAGDLTCWQNADLYKDDIIDVFDLIIMKRYLLSMGGTSTGLPTSVTLNKTSSSITVNQTLQLTATVLPETASNRNVVWTSSDSNIATVSSTGLIKAVAPGKVIITAKTEAGSKQATCTVTVLKPTISLNTNASSLYVGDTTTLTATVEPSEYNVTWSTSDKNIVTVDGGKLKAVVAGKATITAKITVNGIEYSASCAVTVNKVEVKSISVKSNPTKTSYYKGDTLNQAGLTLTANYNNGTSSTVTSGFTCSPTTLNTVGTQKITVTYNGKTTSFNVTVAEVKVSSISVKSNPSKTSYFIGDTLNTSGLVLNVKYNNGTSATVNSNISCTPTSLGTAGTQKITVSYGGQSTSFNVTVNTPKVTLSSPSGSSSDTHVYYGNADGKYYAGIFSLPSASANTGSSISWSIVSGNASVTGGKLYIKQPGTVVARASITYNGKTYSADYTYTRGTKVSIDTSLSLRTEPRVASSTYILTIPVGNVLNVTSLYYDESNYVWGVVTYNGKTGYVALWRKDRKDNPNGIINV